MTNLTPVASLDPVVQLETTTLALGGTGNPMNRQAQALLNRDAFREQQIADAETAANGYTDALRADLAISDESPAPVTIPDAFAQIMIKDRTNAAWYGLKSSATSTEQRAALAEAAAQAKIEGNRLWIPRDTYQLDGGVSIQVPIEMDGGVLDFSAGADFASTSNCGLLIQGDGLTPLPALSADVTQYANQLTFSTVPALSPGDVVCIHNPTDFSWSGFRADYNAGEFVTVSRVSGTTVFLAGFTYDAYLMGAVNIYKVESLSGNFDFNGAEIIGPPISLTGGSGIRFLNLTRSQIYGLTARNANYAQIGVWQSLDVDLYGCNAFTLENTDTGTQYGLSMANTQSVRAHGGTLVSARHGATMGGAGGAGSVVTRDCHVFGAHISARTGSGGGDNAADFHGNVEYSSYDGCTLVGGGTFGGNKNAYRNNKIVSGTSGYALYAAEPKGCDFDFTNNEIAVRGSLPSGRGVFDMITIGANTTLGGITNISGIKMTGADIPNAFGINIRNNGSTASDRRVAIEGLHMSQPTALGPLRMQVTTGSDWAELSVGVVTNPGAESLTVTSTTVKRRTTFAAF